MGYFVQKLRHVLWIDWTLLPRIKAFCTHHTLIPHDVKNCSVASIREAVLLNNKTFVPEKLVKTGCYFQLVHLEYLNFTLAIDRYQVLCIYRIKVPEHPLFRPVPNIANFVCA